LSGDQDDSPFLHPGIERVAGSKAQFSPDRTGNNNLPFAGDPGLHGKNILPQLPPAAGWTEPPIRRRALEALSDRGAAAGAVFLQGFEMVSFAT